MIIGKEFILIPHNGAYLEYPLTWYKGMPLLDKRQLNTLRSGGAFFTLFRKLAGFFNAHKVGELKPKGNDQCQ